MPANTSPIFTLSGRTGWWTAAITAQNTSLAGAGTTGTDVFSVFTAGSNGSFVQRIRFKAAATTGAATCMRVFINNASNSNPVAGDSVLFDEITLPVTTVSTTAATAVYELPLNFALPASYRIMVTSGNSVSGGWYASVIGGDY